MALKESWMRALKFANQHKQGGDHCQATSANGLEQSDAQAETGKGVVHLPRVYAVIVQGLPYSERLRFPEVVCQLRNGRVMVSPLTSRRWTQP